MEGKINSSTTYFPNSSRRESLNLLRYFFFALMLRKMSFLVLLVNSTATEISWSTFSEILLQSHRVQAWIKALRLTRKTNFFTELIIKLSQEFWFPSMSELICGLVKTGIVREKIDFIWMRQSVRNKRCPQNQTSKPQAWQSRFLQQQTKINWIKNCLNDDLSTCFCRPIN